MLEDDYRDCVTAIVKSHKELVKNSESMIQILDRILAHYPDASRYYRNEDWKKLADVIQNGRELEMKKLHLLMSEV